MLIDVDKCVGSGHCVRACKLEKMCLMDIEVQEVIDAIERRLAASGHSRRIAPGG